MNCDCYYQWCLGEMAMLQYLVDTEMIPLEFTGSL